MIETYLYKSTIGILEITGDDKNINAVHFSDDNSETDLAAAPLPVTAAVLQCVHELEAYFSGANLNFSVTVDQDGTAFQQKVWNELLQVKCGQTASYLQVSKKIGNVKAIRAVGMANGKNNVAIIVPCHRIIGNNGNLVGYAGGLWRKKWLLDHEAKFSNGVQNLF